MSLMSTSQGYRSSGSDICGFSFRLSDELLETGATLRSFRGSELSGSYVHFRAAPEGASGSSKSSSSSDGGGGGLEADLRDWTFEALLRFFDVLISSSESSGTIKSSRS